MGVGAGEKEEGGARRGRSCFTRPTRAAGRPRRAAVRSSFVGSRCAVRRRARCSVRACVGVCAVTSAVRARAWGCGRPLLETELYAAHRQSGPLTRAATDASRCCASRARRCPQSFGRSSPGSTSSTTSCTSSRAPRARAGAVGSAHAQIAQRVCDTNDGTVHD